MNGDVAAGLLAFACALLLVGRGVIARYRGGAPIARYALIWIALFGGAFAIASWLGRR